jgi:hypothetical protein
MAPAQKGQSLPMGRGSSIPENSIIDKSIKSILIYKFINIIDIHGSGSLFNPCPTGEVVWADFAFGIVHCFAQDNSLASHIC